MHSDLQRQLAPTSLSSASNAIPVKPGPAFAIGFIALLVLMIVLGPRFLPGHFIADSNFILELRDEITFTDTGGSFFFTAYIFSLFPTWFLDVLLVLTSATVVYISFLRTGSWRDGALVAFLLFPNAVLSMHQLQKETIVFWLLIVVFAASKVRLGQGVVAMFLIVAAYLLYGMNIRNYYMLIAVIFFAICLWQMAPRAFRFAGLVAVISLTLFYVPDPLFDGQRFRDYANLPRVGVDVPGHRTAFLNPLPVEGVGSFLFNYLYASLRLSTPVLFVPSFKDLFLTIYVWTLIYALFRYRRPETREAFFARALIISHLAVLMIFEPDHGTFLRHISSVSLLMAIMINYSRPPDPQGRLSELTATPQADRTG